MRTNASVRILLQTPKVVSFHSDHACLMSGFHHYVATVSVISKLYCRSQIPLLPKKIRKKIMFCLSHKRQKSAVAVCPLSSDGACNNDTRCWGRWTKLQHSQSRPGRRRSYVNHSGARLERTCNAMPSSAGDHINSVISSSRRPPNNR